MPILVIMNWPFYCYAECTNLKCCFVQYNYADCCSVECGYNVYCSVEGSYAVCYSVEGSYAVCYSVEGNYAVCYSVEGSYAVGSCECCYAGCRYAESRSFMTHPIHNFGAKLIKLKLACSGAMNGNV